MNLEQEIEESTTGVYFVLNEKETEMFLYPETVLMDQDHKGLVGLIMVVQYIAVVRFKNVTSAF